MARRARCRAAKQKASTTMASPDTTASGAAAPVGDDEEDGLYDGAFDDEEGLYEEDEPSDADEQEREEQRHRRGTKRAGTPTAASDAKRGRRGSAVALPWYKRIPVWAYALGALAVAGLIAGIVALVVRLRGTKAPPALPAAPEPARAPIVADAVSHPDRVAVVRTAATAMARAQRLGALDRQLSDDVPADMPPALRGAMVPPPPGSDCAADNRSAASSPAPSPPPAQVPPPQPALAPGDGFVPMDAVPTSAARAADANIDRWLARVESAIQEDNRAAEDRAHLAAMEDAGAMPSGGADCAIDTAAPPPTDDSVGEDEVRVEP